MKLKGVGRIFIICIFIIISLYTIKNVIQLENFTIPEFVLHLIPEQSHKLPKKKHISNIESNIHTILNKMEVKESEINTQMFLESRLREIRAKIPKGKPFEWTIWLISQATKGTKYSLIDCFHNKKRGLYSLTFEKRNSKKDYVSLILSNANRYLSNSAKIAILIEDFNFEADKITVDYLSFTEPLTFSLTPYLKKSSWTAEAANTYNKEILINLPFESAKKKKEIPYKSTIMLHYPEVQITKIFNQAIKKVPNFSGFSNLNSSPVLSDSRAMSIVLNNIKKHHAYFIECRSTKSSVVSIISEKLKVPYQKINFSIDEKTDAAAIEELLRHYTIVALKKSKILISARPSMAFLKALKNVLPEMKQNGIRLVYVSEIVNHPKIK